MNPLSLVSPLTKGCLGAIVALILLGGGGCASLSDSKTADSKSNLPVKTTRSLTARLTAKGRNEEALRKKVEEDKFPTAEQAGI